MDSKKRILWIDIAKAIAIFLVVFGHTARGGDAQRIIYSFHVSTFFLLSGMTFREKRIGEQIKNDFLHIMVPYYCFGLISIFIFLFLGKFAAAQLGLDIDSSLKSNLLGLIYANPISNSFKFNMPLWFLPCLFATKLLYNIIHIICHGKKLPVFLSSLIVAVIGFVYTEMKTPNLPFNLAVSFKMVAFFSLGHMFALWLPTINQKYLTKLKTLSLGSILLVVTAVIAFFCPQVDYASDYFPNIPLFLLTSVLGSFGVCFLSMGIGKCKVFEYAGRKTLAILVMHKFPILLFQTVGPLKSLLAQHNTPLGIISAVLISLLAIAMCIAVDWIIVRIFPFILGDFSRLSRR